MPQRRRSASPGKRKRAWPSGGRFSTRARVIAGAAAALAVLAVLAVSELGGGSPDPGRAAPAAPKPPRTHPATGAANPNPSAHPITGPTPPPADPALTLGRPGVPVTIVEFGDYQCTNCGAFARGTEPALIRTYVDTGVARLVWRDFPWVDAQSVAPAVAARAAGMQGKFWAYHDYLFAHQFPDDTAAWSPAPTCGRWRGRLGLNMTRFDRDVASPALAAAVRADDTFGQQLGVPGTPAFLIGGRPFFGAQTLAAFEAVIAQARKRR